MSPDQKAQVETAALKVFVVALIGELGRNISAKEGNALVSRLMDDSSSIAMSMGVDVSEASWSENEFRSAIVTEIDDLLGSIKFHD